MVELIDEDDQTYNTLKDYIILNSHLKKSSIFDILDKCRDFSKNNLPGINIIRYLLFRLNNKIIKLQLSTESCDKLSDLNVNIKCKPFDDMPFCTSLCQHNPKFTDVLNCIDANNREHEILTKKLILNAEVSGKLFTPLDELNCFNDIDGQIDLYNHSLYYKHFERKIGKFDNFLYIVGYVLDTTFIIEELKKLSLEGLKGYENSVLSWININSSQIDCDEKKKILVNLFSKSKVALIMGQQEQESLL